MEWAKAIEVLPNWGQAFGVDSVSAPGDSEKGLGDLISIRPLPSSKFACISLVSQSSSSSSSSSSSDALVRVAVLSRGSPQIEVTSREVKVHIPNYIVSETGAFQQLLVGAGCRGALLLAPRCCAAFALPGELLDLTKEGTDCLEATAVALEPPEGTTFVKVAWHPLSDVHVAVLLSDGTWQLLNLSHRATVTDPEVQFAVTFGGLEPGESVTDFVFCGPPAGEMNVGAADAAWLSMAVLFLSSRGRMCFRSPVLPCLAALPAAAIDALVVAAGTADAVGTAEELHEWVRSTMLTGRGESARAENLAGQCVAVKHRLHLHGSTEVYHRRWRPVEQLLLEERSEAQADASPCSPRHVRSRYCSIQLVAHSPTAVVARATSSGLVELLVINSGFSPAFVRLNQEPENLLCTIFDEIDLATSLAKSPAVRLSLANSPEGSCACLIARSRGLVAAIELHWGDALQAGTVAALECLPSTSVTTLVELRTADGPGEIAGWQLVEGATQIGQPRCIAGLWLRIRESATDKGLAVQAVDLSVVLKAAAKLRASKPDGPGGRARSHVVGPAAQGSNPQREEYLRHLAAPLLLPAPLFANETSPAAVAKALAAVRAGQVADLSSRSVVLRHLATHLPERAKTIKNELAVLRRGEARLRQAAEAQAKKAALLRKDQEDILAKQKKLVETLGAVLELHSLEGIQANELPRLWAQMHELRQASDLLKAAATGRESTMEANLGSDLSTLHRAWTGSAGQLTAQTAHAEAAVAAMSKRAAR